MRVCGNLTSLALIKYEMRANRLIIQNPPSQQELLILTPACTKSLINECFQLCRRQPIHSYLAFSFWPISTKETKWWKERGDQENKQKYNFVVYFNVLQYIRRTELGVFKKFGSASESQDSWYFDLLFSSALLHFCHIYLGLIMFVFSF